MTEYSFHRYANIFPLLDGEALDRLAADIRANGLLEPIVMLDGAILDGRNRYRACELAGVPARFVDYDGANPLAFVISKNRHRRHLTSGQLAAIAVQQEELMAELEQEARARMLAGVPADPTEIFQEGRSNGETSDHVADLFGTNPRYIYDAKRLKAEAPDLLEQVAAGELTLPEAKKAQQQRERQERSFEHEMRRVYDAARVTTVTDALTVTGGARYQTVVIDPPWDWGDEGDVNQLGRARPTYATMPLEEIAALPISEIAADNAHLYLWITNRSLPKGFGLIEQWGFRYILALTWVKPHFGMGNYFRGSTEHVLFAVRGSLPLLRHDVGTHFMAARGGGHSAKPEEFYQLIETCSPGPRIDMFARVERPGWSAWGNLA